MELRLRVFALPLAIAVAWGVAHTGIPHALMRIFLSMWIHESGHALTAWLCGLPSFPGPWFTPVAQQRSWIFGLCLAAVLAFCAERAWRSKHRVVAVLCGILLLLQGIGTLAFSLRRAQELMIFGGDAGCMVLGTLLMATLYVRRDHVLHRGWLRWGFLVIGAAAFCDAYATWWDARKNFDSIPFGENEGSGHRHHGPPLCRTGRPVPGRAGCVLRARVAAPRSRRARAGQRRVAADFTG